MSINERFYVIKMNDEQYVRTWCKNSTQITMMIPTRDCNTSNHQTSGIKRGLFPAESSATRNITSNTVAKPSATLIMARSNLIREGALAGTNSVNAIALMNKAPVYTLINRYITAMVIASELH